MIRSPRASNRLSSVLLPALGLSLAVGLVACTTGSGGTSPSFSVSRTSVSVASSTPVVFFAKNMAFLADEATTGAGGTDMNGDGDVIDSIAYAVNLGSHDETNLAVAAQALAWIGDELYIQVDEALDGRNWEDVDSGDKIVLLHWSAADPVLTFVDRVASAGTVKMIPVGSNLFYSTQRAPTTALESNLQVLRSSDPLVPIEITTQDDVGPLSPRLIEMEENLIFLALDEPSEARDLNGDGDMVDTNVLALLDGTSDSHIIRSTELALPATGSPLRAKSTSSNDWQIGFLVSESEQGGTNLNDQALFSASWKPSQCAASTDVDATDDVLFYIKFSNWDNDPVVNPPVNTGLVGCRQIAIANNFVATISPEVNTPEPGAEGTCDLNQDGDTDDYVVRWVKMETPVLPLTSAANIHALFDVPGGDHGLAELQDRFVIVVSEEEDDLDINGDALKTFNLVGWLSPSGSSGSNTPWDFTQGTNNDSFVGASWMTEQPPDQQRLGLALEESVEGININSHVPPVPGEDTDTLDSVPTFPDFTGNPTHLGFPGVAIAVQPANAGIVVAKNYGFYRVEEADDSRDWNGPNDTDEQDFILFRTSLQQGISGSMGVLNSIPGRLSIDVNLNESSPFGAAFLAEEQQQGPTGTDFNGDGDTTDLVISYFKF